MAHDQIRRLIGDSLDAIDIDIQSSLEEFYSERGIARVTLKSTATGKQRHIGVPFTVSVHKPVWVVKNTIPANTPVTRRDLVLENRSVGRYAEHVVGNELDLSRYITRVNLQPGEMLDKRQLVMPPDIKRNDPVHIMIDAGNGINVSVMGEALADGRIGQTIRVKHMGPNRRKPRYFNAEVVARNRVLVHM